MRRAEALQRLAAERCSLAAFKVAALSLFGSVARDEAREDSDVDILVEFTEPVGLFQFARLKRHLEGILGSRVDLATLAALKAQVRDRILAEAIRAE